MRFACIQVLLVASLALAQTPANTTATPAPKPFPTSVNAGTALRRPKPSSVAPDTPVITIMGLCEAASRPKTGTTPAKRAAGSDCKTVVTRAQFDALAEAIQPNLPSAAKFQLANIYPKLLLMQREFRKYGLEKDPKVQRALAFTRVRSEAEEMAKALKEKADDVPNAEIEKYYTNNPSEFEQFELQRIFVPKERKQEAKDNKPEPKQESAKSSEAEKDSKEESTEAAEKAKADNAKADDDRMKELADALHAQAVAGEDFEKLQKQAIELAGLQAGASANLGKLTAHQLPPAHLVVTSMKPGEVSQVFVDPNGYYIYKIVSKSTKPLEQVRADIKTNLAQRRFADAMQSVEQSAKTVLNETYFPTPNAARGFGGRDQHGIRQITIPPPTPEPVAAHPAAPSPEAPKN